jgi:hypothetical protein
MQIRFHCPSCDLPMRISRWETLRDFSCPACKKPIPSHVDEKAQNSGEIDHCLVCKSPHLFRQKLFNRNWGIGIVVAGIIVSFFVSLPIVPLLVVALIDAVLFLVLPFMIVCYRCDAELRGFKVGPEFKPFDHLKAAQVKKQPTYPGAREGHNEVS